MTKRLKTTKRHSRVMVISGFRVDGEKLIVSMRDNEGNIYEWITRNKGILKSVGKSMRIRYVLAYKYNSISRIKGVIFL